MHKFPKTQQEELLIGIGDLHGHLPALEKLLSYFQEKESIFSNPHEYILRPGVEIVFTGDYIDRGTQSRELIDILISLRERNSYAVHELFGNHELIALSCLPIAKSLIDTYEKIALNIYRTTAVHGYNGGDIFVNEFSVEGKNTFSEYVHQMSRGQKIGNWMRSLEALYLTTTIDGKRVLFVHGGVPYNIENKEDLDNYTEKFKKHMFNHGSILLDEAKNKYLKSTVVDDNSPFWDRGSPKMDEESVKTLTSALNVDFIVIGHTPQRNGCFAVYHNKIINVDIGMNPYYGENVPAAIVFKNNQVHAVYTDGRDDLLVE